MLNISSIVALLLAVVVSGSAVTEPEHDPASRKADMAEFGIVADVAEEPEVQKTPHYDIPLSDVYQDYVEEVCAVYGLDARVIYGIAYQESRFTADAVGDHGQSFGMYQCKRKCHEDRIARLGVNNLLDEWQSIWVCADHLSELLGTYGNYRDALTAYRYGDLNVTGEDYAGVVLGVAYGLVER